MELMRIDEIQQNFWWWYIVIRSKSENLNIMWRKNIAEMDEMNIIIGMVSLFAGIAGVWGIYIIFRNNSLRERSGRSVLGKKLSCTEIIGQPIRYIVEVEYQLNNDVHRRKIVTSDKRIKEYKDNEQILLLYVEELNKIFWAEDHSNEWLGWILMLIVFCCFMFMLTCVLWFLA